MACGTDHRLTAGGGEAARLQQVRRQRRAASTPRPYGSWFDEAVDALEQGYPGFDDTVVRVVVDRGELTLHVLPDKVDEIAQVLRDDAESR